MIADLKKAIQTIQSEISSFRSLCEEDFFEFGTLDTAKQKHGRTCIRMLEFSVKEMKKVVDKWEFLSKYTIS